MGQYPLTEGSVVRLLTALPFTSISNTLVNPDVVTLTWDVQGTTPTTYTWTNGGSPPDPSGTIVNDSTGYFHADLPTDGLAGTWSCQWTGRPGVSGLDATKTEVVADFEVIVSAAAF